MNSIESLKGEIAYYVDRFEKLFLLLEHGMNSLHDAKSRNPEIDVNTAYHYIETAWEIGVKVEEEIQEAKNRADNTVDAERLAQSDNANHVRDAVDENLTHQDNLCNTHNELIPDKQVQLNESLSVMSLTVALNNFDIACVRASKDAGLKAQNEKAQMRIELIRLIVAKGEIYADQTN